MFTEGIEYVGKEPCKLAKYFISKEIVMIWKRIADESEEAYSDAYSDYQRKIGKKIFRTDSKECVEFIAHRLNIRLGSLNREIKKSKKFIAIKRVFYNEELALCGELYNGSIVIM